MTSPKNQGALAPIYARSEFEQIRKSSLYKIACYAAAFSRTRLMKNRSLLHTHVTHVIFEGISCSDLVHFCLKLMFEVLGNINSRKNAKIFELMDQIGLSFWKRWAVHKNWIRTLAIKFPYTSYLSVNLFVSLWSFMTNQFQTDQLCHSFVKNWIRFQNLLISNGHILGWCKLGYRVRLRHLSRK